jgi:P27 family predicted phage terminase small subunit
MAKGRKPEPTKLKLVKGTARADRINPAAPEPAKDGLNIPPNLTEGAHAHFRTLHERLKGLGLDSSTYTETVAMAAARMAEIDYCTDVISAHSGPTYETETIQGGRMIRAYPEVAMRNEAMRHLHSLLSELGLTPSAIGKVGAKAPEKPKSKFGGFAS